MNLDPDRHLSELFALLLRLVPPSYPGRASGASEEQLATLEELLGQSLPDPVRGFLRLTNGMGPRGGSLLGIGDAPFGSIAQYLDWNPSYRSSGLLPVGTDGCGNLYVLNTIDGRVYFHDAANPRDEMGYEASSSCWRFYVQMIATECRPDQLLHDRELLEAWDPDRAARSN